MSEFIYTVSATFVDPQLADQWVSWLEGGHIQEVMRVGRARQAEIVKLDGTANVVQVRYCFESAEAFATYERDHAPRLRKEGLERFPAGQNIQYNRSTGRVIAGFSEAAKNLTSPEVSL